MITYSKLGKHGRLGNQLFQVAFTYSLAHTHSADWCLPEWKYARYFENRFPIKNVHPAAVLKEGRYKYQSNIFDAYKHITKDHIVDIEGYFQHSEYWPNKNEIKQLFKFDCQFFSKLKESKKNLLEKPFVAVGVRRGDYIGNNNYYNLPIGWYLTALEKFPNQNIVFFSDDIEWCKFHFSCIPNSYFPKFDLDIEALAFGTLAENWIIANSTFHWWSAFLSNAKRIIQPTRYFSGDLLRKEGNENFYNKEWESHSIEKVDLSDVTITIPVKYDHSDREVNLERTINLIKKEFNTNIVVGEQGGNHFDYIGALGAKYQKFDLAHFHRTRMLNVMAAEAITPIVANWDVDVMVPPAQLYEAVKQLRAPATNPKLQVVYPYNNLFQRIDKQYASKFSGDLSIYKEYSGPSFAIESVGGALLYNKQAFFSAGGENENFVAYSPEDKERYHRFKKLGLTIDRVPGRIYHFDHWCGPDSNKKNPFYAAGKAELARIKGMQAGGLKAEVKEWKNKRGY